MLNVFLTVDTEVWPFSPGWPVTALSPDKSGFKEEIDTYIYGRTTHGDYGLPFQMKTLNQHELKATFFLEALFAGRARPDYLKEVVHLVQDNGHEVQLHLHTEWLGEINDPSVPYQFRQFIHEFTLEEQIVLVNKGIQNLRAAGVSHVQAFRAGGYGASQDTLKALARNGLMYDTSYNACYLDSGCEIHLPRPLLQPEKIHDIWEFPVSFFQDYPGHYRHTQLCACSFGEMKAALLEAWRAGWFSFVVVLHGSELVRNGKGENISAPDRINVKRFEQLCAFLAENRDKFRTTVFSDIDVSTIPSGYPEKILCSTPLRTVWRFMEQGVGRFI
jgi:hypothetical protein